MFVYLASCCLDTYRWWSYWCFSLHSQPPLLPHQVYHRPYSCSQQTHRSPAAHQEEHNETESEKLKHNMILTVQRWKNTSSRTFSLSSASCSDSSKPHLFLRRFLRFCLFFSSFSSLARSSSDSSSTSCSSRLMPCIFSTAIWSRGKVFKTNKQTNTR